MPNQVSNVSFQSPYSVEQGEIDRRRKIAEALQGQAMQPNPTEMVGGWAVRKSPMEHIAKALQMGAGAYSENKASEDQKQLNQKYQDDLVRTLTEAQRAGQGTPGSPQPPPELGGGPAQPAQAPDRQAMARILMEHPATQQLGVGQMQQDMTNQSFMQSAQPPAPSNPMAAGGGSVMAPPGQAPQGFGGPAGGVPMATWLAGDLVNGRMKYLEQLAKDYAEGQKPVVNRGFGIGTMQGGKYVPDQASLDQALSMEKGREGVQAQFRVGSVNTPGSPTLMTGQQQIEAATGRPMPGSQAPQQPQQTPGLPPNVPPEDANAFKYVQENARRGQPVKALGQSQYSGPERRLGLKLQGQGEQKAEVEMGEGLGKRYNSIQDAGFNANQKMQKFDRLGGLLSEIDTGKLTPAGTEISAWAKSAGFPIGDKVDNAQAAKAMANEMALELRNPSGGAGMPGAMSDSDRNYLQSLIANIDKTPGTNKLLLEGMTKLAQRDREVAQLARDYKKKNGSFDDGFYDELGKFSDSNPLFKKQQTVAMPVKGLTPQETTELEQLRTRFGRR